MNRHTINIPKNHSNNCSNLCKSKVHRNIAILHFRYASTSYPQIITTLSKLIIPSNVLE